MKNGQKTRKQLGKISSFLRGLSNKNNKATEARRNFRNPDKIPNSTKVGAGEITARRNLPNGTLHKRNHRSAVKIGIVLTRNK